MKSRCKQTARKSFPCPNYPKTAIKSTPPATKATSNESARLTPKTIIGKFGQDCVTVYVTKSNSSSSAIVSSYVSHSRDDVSRFGDYVNAQGRLTANPTVGRNENDQRLLDTAAATATGQFGVSTAQSHHQLHDAIG